MSKNIDLIAFGTFGIPNGFRQTLFLGDSVNFSKVKTFDLNTNAIKLFPNTKIYSIRKQQINGYNTIAYSVYSFAKEKNSDRGGTFIGSSIIFHNIIAKEDLIINCLDEFHNELISNKSNVDNSVIQVSHSDNFKPFKIPRDFNKLAHNLKEAGEINFSTTNKDLAVYSLIKPELLASSLELLNVFDTIFFTKSEEVAKFVYEKQLIKLVQNQQDFEAEIQSVRLEIEEEKKRILNQAIEKIEREIIQFENNRKQYIDKNNSLIESNKKQLEENKSQIDKFQKQYNEDKHQIENLVNHFKELSKQFDIYKTHLETAVQELKEGIKLPLEISKQLEDHQKLLEEAKSKFKIPNIIKISDSQNRISVHKNSYPYKDGHRTTDTHRYTQKSSSSKYKIISIFLFFIWIATMIYFLFDEEKLTGIKNIFGFY
jgi:hypothetical protein